MTKLNTVQQSYKRFYNSLHQNTKLLKFSQNFYIILQHFTQLFETLHNSTQLYTFVHNLDKLKEYVNVLIPTEKHVWTDVIPTMSQIDADPR